MSKLPNVADASTPDRQFVTALARGLAVLRCFDRPRLEVSVSELARRTGLSQPTVWRLCHTLLETGFLVRAPSGPALRIGAPAITLGYAATRGLDAPAVALPYMQRVLERSGANMTLSVRHGGEMVAVEQLNGAFVVRNQPPGWRAPLDGVASGLAVLAAMPEAERDAAIAQIAYPNAERRSRHRARIDQAVAEFEEHGFVRLEHILDGRYAAVGVPLFAPGSSPAGQWAMTGGGLVAHWGEDGIAAAAALLVETRDLLVPAFAALADRAPAT